MDVLRIDDSQSTVLVKDRSLIGIPEGEENAEDHTITRIRSAHYIHFLLSIDNIYIDSAPDRKWILPFLLEFQPPIRSYMSSNCVARLNPLFDLLIIDNSIQLLNVFIDSNRFHVYYSLIMKTS